MSVPSGVSTVPFHHLGNGPIAGALRPQDRGVPLTMTRGEGSRFQKETGCSWPGSREKHPSFFTSSRVKRFLPRRPNGGPGQSGPKGDILPFGSPQRWLVPLESEESHRPPAWLCRSTCRRSPRHPLQTHRVILTRELKGFPDHPSIGIPPVLSVSQVSGAIHSIVPFSAVSNCDTQGLPLIKQNLA